MDLKNIPSLDKYLTLKEIKKNFQNISQEQGFSKQIIGYSNQNRTIELLKYSHSLAQKNSVQERPRILLYGGEDATEPIFSQTINWIINTLDI